MAFVLSRVYLSKEKKNEKDLNIDCSGNQIFIEVITNLQIAIDLQSTPRRSRKLPCKKSHLLADDSSSIRSASLKDMTSFRLV